MIRTEYAARLASGLIYLKDWSAPFVAKFVTDMAPITPIHMVTRTWVGDVHSDWERAA
ncbi:hypothetical protein [Pseudarthrobacter sp. NIBRBAC000502772]|uniref:hypothetical protein n=1 Tax=Pseudarthrobacter sp. NIBRBAC000502772 TaxID=2590775 RepID=UPI00143DCCD6|nr:hypothetical protein [Pseudarthrobacter sp. NIBRBAC000502772]